MKRYKTVDAYVESLDTWHDEIAKLRDIMLSTGLEETIKWGRPAYCHQGKTVVGLADFKDHCAVWFHQGALLEDEAGLLCTAQEKTKALRHWRIESGKDIKVRLMKKYLREAMQNVEAGKAIKADRSKPVVVPAMLKAALVKNPKAKAAFDAMGKGCRREYADYIAEAKRDETKQRRIEKILPMIVKGAGLNDKYRK